MKLFRLYPIFLALVAILAILFACGGDSSNDDEGFVHLSSPGGSSSSNGLPSSSGSSSSGGLSSSGGSSSSDDSPSSSSDLSPRCGGVAYNPEERLCDDRDNKLYRIVEIFGQVWMGENLNFAAKGKCYAEGVSGVSQDSINKNCAAYGKLYDWSDAMDVPLKCNTALSTSDADCAIKTLHQGICPKGYHIPSDAEWTTLANNTGGAGSTGKAGMNLKAKEGWVFPPSDTCKPILAGGIPSGSTPPPPPYACEDAYGFTAKPGGVHNGIPDFVNIGKNATWRSSTEGGANNAHRVGVGAEQDVFNDIGTASATMNSNKGTFLVSIRCLKD
jgi:uncharacterized protein (TIGR02145 family)